MTLTMNNAPRGESFWSLSIGTQKTVLSLGVGVLASASIRLNATALENDAKIVLIVTIFAVIGWIATRLPDSLVALIAALAPVVSGARLEEALTNTLGEQIVWLLLAAFVIDAVIKEAGLAERLVAPLTRSASRMLPFFLMTSDLAHGIPLAQHLGPRSVAAARLPWAAGSLVRPALGKTARASFPNGWT